MQISNSMASSSMPSMSTMKSANQQPQLAGELIDKTVQGMAQPQVQSAQQPARPVQAPVSMDNGRAQPSIDIRV